MAFPKSPVLLLVFFLVAALLTASNGGGLAIYWGQGGGELSLKEACETDLFKYVVISFVTEFGNGSTPILNLDDHCNPSAGECVKYGDEIKDCQKRDIKVFLSIGGSGSYILVSREDAKQFADYLWDNYLGGNSTSRPFGDAIVNGIDFDIAGRSPDHYDDLAEFLSNFSTPEEKVYLSAAPQCFYPDYWLSKALSTGLFDYVWVQFYDNTPCQYSSGDASKLVNSWTNEWTKNAHWNYTVLGLTSSAAISGFIPVDDLIKLVLPNIENVGNYGGVMLWGESYNDKINYATAIKDYVFTLDASM